MSMFAHRTARGCNAGRRLARSRALDARAAERRQIVDLFAECLAEGGAVDRCAAGLGKGKAWGQKALAEICAALGREQCR